MLSLKKILFALFCMAFLLAGCSTSLNTGDLRLTREQRAIHLAEKGDYSGAAYIFEHMAKDQAGEKRIKSLLSAANYYLLASDLGTASRILQELGPLDAGKFPLQRILEADLLLRRGDSSAALSRLGDPPATGDSYVTYRYYTTLSRIHMARNEEDAALNAMLQLDAMPVGGSYRLANQRAIIALLASMNTGKRYQLMNSSNRTLAGWAMLADILEHSPSPAEKNRRLASWKASYASHPALRELYDEDAARTAYRGGDIAVLLPMSGVYANASSAIRKGIEVTLAQLPLDTQPALTFIDSTNLAAGLQQAEGASILLGPLTKESVEQVVSSGGYSEMMITLNQVSDYSPSGVYQFGLSTEVEGAQVAEKAQQDGWRNAAVIYPNAGWGARYLQGFRDRFESLGGNVVVAVRYEQGEKEFSALMQNVMQTNPDFVFIVAKPVTARQIRQQVRFYGSSETPVYASSTAYDRRLYGVQDRDFDNVKVPALRWTVPGQDVPYVPSWSTMEAAGDFNPGLAKFYALGIDALLLAVNSESLESGGMLAGATGDLSFSNNGIVDRRMMWLHYQGGLPVPTAY
jgi:uncharacterized protein